MSQSKILLESGTNELEIVEFFINEKDGYRGYYGINVAKVVEIIRPEPVTAMPQMRHPCVKGAFPYRNGRIVPLIDLCNFLDKGPLEDADSKIIITEFNKLQNGFLVSGVTRIHRISWSQVEAPGAFLESMSRQSITGVIRLENRVVFLLDLEDIIATLHPALVIQMGKYTPGTSPGTKYRLLHADDSHSIRTLVKGKLGEEGHFDVIQVNDGKAAWDTLTAWRQKATEENRPITDFVQGIITDIEMPHLDGLTLCRYIKEDPILKVLPVAVFSSLITPPLEHKAESVGADTQFAKPDLQSISDRMRELIENHTA